MRPVTWDSGFLWEDPNLRWGNPSFQLEPGDPGYVPWPPPKTKHKHKNTMKRESYLPREDTKISNLLMTLNNGLTTALATKYNITAEQRWRLKQGWLAFDHLLAYSTILADARQGFTALREGMFVDGEGSTPIPTGPTLPAVPTIEPLGGGAAVPVQVEADFFDFLSRVVAQIKEAEVYDPADGQTLGIVGPEIPPPPADIKPLPKLKIGPSGQPVVTCKKSPFQGYQVEVARGTGAFADAGFATAREYEIPLPLPPVGQTETWKVRVQYRLKNELFGQLSDMIEIDVRGR
jgi:hypothetical protein